MQLESSHRWRGERIELFLLRPSDVTDAYVGWLNDPIVNRYLESRFSAHDDASTRQFVASALADARVLMLGIRSRELGKHVGNIKLGPIDLKHRTADIGIMIGDRDAWGRGIASDAIRSLVAIARDELGLRKLTAGCYESNAGSAKAFQKVGFAIEGRREAQYLLDDRAEASVLLGLVL